MKDAPTAVLPLLLRTNLALAMKPNLWGTPQNLAVDFTKRLQ